MTQRPKAYSYIRMSTEMQLRGDSKRRQEDMSRAYAAKHNLILVEGLELHDIGVSAYKGANVKSDNALGRFIWAAQNGEVDEGSYLLVESLDRLSRMQIMESLALFIQIISAGIKIVTLVDDMVYDKDQTEFYELLYSMVVMSRAHEESKMKSTRIAASWSEKRKTAGSKIMTAQCPKWLEAKADRSGFKPLKKRVEIIERLFDLSEKGMGDYAIAKLLNQEGSTPFGHGKSWNASSVGSILKNPAVLGEFQPYKNGPEGRVPDGPMLRDYYPAIIDEDQYYRVQHARSARAGPKGAGRKGNKGLANIFSGVAHCGPCGGKMTYLDKSNASYLQCAQSRKAGTCESKGYPYKHFEQSFLSFVLEMDFSTIGKDGLEKSDRFRLVQTQKSLDEKIKTLKQQRGRTFELIEGDAFDSAYVRVRLSDLEDQIILAEQELHDVEHGLKTYGIRTVNPEKLAELALKIQENTEDYVLRSHVAQLIKDQVAFLMLYPNGSVALQEQSRGALRTSLTEEGLSEGDQGQLLDHLTQMDHGSRSFVVSFKHHPHAFRQVTPDPKDPSKLEVTVTGGDLARLVDHWSPQGGSMSIDMEDNEMARAWPAPSKEKV